MVTDLGPAAKNELKMVTPEPEKKAAPKKKKKKKPEFVDDEFLEGSRSSLI